ncbi:MAG: dihydropteroate synthase [bacterium]|nr:dihydropteroate synthase [bacterium]
MSQDLQIVGILNTTPDSYFDGGEFNAVDAAVKRAGEMIEQGVDIIEIGGQSTGPGSTNVSIEEEINRTIPIIKAIKAAYPDAFISIDTFQSEVAKQAIEAGVMMINDVTAGRGDSEVFNVVSAGNVPIVLMYAKDSSARTTKEEMQYDDVIATITVFLSERKAAAVHAGIADNNIILDPGLGHFVSSDPCYSFEIIERLHEFQELGCPLFISPSRKSFLAGKENLPTADRLPATIAASVMAVKNGATYIRTHDVAEVRRGCAM